MVRLIFASGLIISLLGIASCKKESSCTDLSAYTQNRYVLKDSIVYLHDSTSIITDTISFNRPPYSRGDFFINQLGPEVSPLLAGGCAVNFSVDTSTGTSGIFFGTGSIVNNGNNITLTVTRVPISGYTGDTAFYYCIGVKL